MTACTTPLLPCAGTISASDGIAFEGEISEADQKDSGVLDGFGHGLDEGTSLSMQLDTDCTATVDKWADGATSKTMAPCHFQTWGHTPTMATGWPKDTVCEIKSRDDGCGLL